MTDSNDQQPTLLSKSGRWVKKAILTIVLVGGVGFCLWTWISLKFVYSRGERAGFIQKFSKKGWIFKTWEGELAMVNLPGTMPEIFNFSVRDDEAAKKLQDAMGQRIVLQYEEHRGIPTTIFAETNYFVNDVLVIGSADSRPPTTPPAP